MDKNIIERSKIVSMAISGLCDKMKKHEVLNESLLAIGLGAVGIALVLKYGIPMIAAYAIYKFGSGVASQIKDAKDRQALATRFLEKCAEKYETEGRDAGLKCELVAYKKDYYTATKRIKELYERMYKDNRLTRKEKQAIYELYQKEEKLLSDIIRKINEIETELGISVSYYEKA